MVLAAGTKLGPYEVQSALGAGGMGEVYRARDTRLERTVAVKVLPPDRSGRADLRQRFEREARAISSLSHPHICQLYDVGHQDGIDYLVMEYLEGETLADRLGRGPLPPEQVLKLGAALADALDRAHRAGVIHRDIKPANIMLTKAGAKLLDFGLARAAESAAAASVTATRSKPLTQEGTIVGTYHYMAPEQIEGGAVDARTDIFALGALLFEAATGRMAFPGKTQASVIAAILASDPPAMSSLEPLTPPGLERVVRACLAKDPEERIQSAHDIRMELEWVAAAQPVAEAGRPRARAWWPMLAAALVALVGIGIAVWVARRAPPPQATYGVARFTITLPGQMAVSTDTTQPIAISRDGRHLAYVASRNGIPYLFVRALDGFDSVEIPQSENAGFPFFSPDGEWVGFFSHGHLEKAPLNGGNPVVICDLPTFYGAAWLADNSILFAGPGLGVGVVSAGGGTPRSVPVDNEDNEPPVRPTALPGDEWVAVTQIRGTNERLMAVRRSTGEMHLLLNNAQMGYYSAGRLIYYSGGAIWAIPYDAKAVAVQGEPVQLESGVAEQGSAAEYAASENGVLAYLPGAPGNVTRNILLLGRGGAARKLDLPANDFVDPAFSPDGKRIAMVLRQPAIQQLAVYDLQRGVMMSLVTSGRNAAPAWTSDGRYLVYDAMGTDIMKETLYRVAADGSAPPELLLKVDHNAHVTSIAGDTAAVMVRDPKAGTNLWLLSLAKRELRAFRPTPAMERQGSFSPDGKWIAYVSNESGRNEIYVEPVGGSGGRWQISAGGGEQPRWCRCGREIFYRNGTRMMSVPVETEPAFRAGKPAQLFETDFDRGGAVAGYDASPDGRWFLVTRSEQSQPKEIRVVAGWPQALKQR
jgi:Tol biopolymer transport system component/predicted Ser/Thr protein kinase